MLGDEVAAWLDRRLDGGREVRGDDVKAKARTVLAALKKAESAQGTGQSQFKCEMWFQSFKARFGYVMDERTGLMRRAVGKYTVNAPVRVPAPEPRHSAGYAPQRAPPAAQEYYYRGAASSSSIPARAVAARYADEDYDLESEEEDDPVTYRKPASCTSRSSGAHLYARSTRNHPNPSSGQVDPAA